MLDRNILMEKFYRIITALNLPPLSPVNIKKWFSFGLCRDYLLNVKDCDWNHKCIYKIYCELVFELTNYE